MKNCPSVAELREMGMQVRIYHHRVFRGIGQWTLDGNNVDNVLTRGEYNKAKEKKELEFENSRAARLYGEVLPENVDYGRAVSPTSGFTTVEITTPDGVQLKGKFNFGKNEPFCRQKGVRAAIGRALNGSRIVNCRVVSEVPVHNVE